MKGTTWELNPETGFSEQFLTRRELLYRRVMTWLNAHSQQGSSHFFDCGEQGILHMYWGRYGWEHRWVQINDLPDDLPEWEGRYTVRG